MMDDSQDEQSQPAVDVDVDQASQVPYTISILDASKDGEIVKYTIQTKTKENDKSEGGVIVLRQYEDFEYLHHCIMAHNDVRAVVVPSLPPKTPTTPTGAEAKTKKQLGKESKTMVGDEFAKDCRTLQKYLELVISRPTLNKDETLKTFLTADEAPIRVAVKKGIFNSLKDALDETRFHKHKDIDEEFQKARDFVDQCAANTKNCFVCHDKMVHSEQRCAQHVAEFSTIFLNCEVCTTENEEEERFTALHNTFRQFANALDLSKRSIEQSTIIDEDTLGFTLGLYSPYTEAAKEMLFRRTCKLVEFENASKALEKAKPKNQEQLEKAKTDAEQEYEDITVKARDEIAIFHRERVTSFQQSLISLAEGQIKNGQDTYALLTNALAGLKGSS